MGRKIGRIRWGWSGLFGFFFFVLALPGGAEYCNKKSKKDYEDFQGPGKKSVALGYFTLYLHFVRSESSFILLDCESTWSASNWMLTQSYLV